MPPECPCCHHDLLDSCGCTLGDLGLQVCDGCCQCTNSYYDYQYRCRLTGEHPDAPPPVTDAELAEVYKILGATPKTEEV